MKYILTPLLCIVFISSNGQNNLDEAIYYTYKINGNIKDGNKDSLKINSEKSFVIKIDTTALGDTLQLFESRIVEKYSKKNITVWDNTYKLNEEEKIIFEFEIKRINKTENAAKPNEVKNKIIQLIVIREKKEKNADEKMRELVTTTIKEALLEESKDKNIGQFEIQNEFVELLLDITSDKKKKEKPVPEIKGFIKIDSVFIRLEDGVISRRGILVKAINTTTKKVLYFRNLKASIDLSKNEYEYNHKLYLDNNKTSKEYILFGNLLKYTFSGKFCYPDNGEYYVTQKEKVAKVYNKITLRDILNISIFSDVLSLLGRRANGIIQTEVSANFITNTRNAKEGDFVWWSHTSPYFSFAIFDSKFQQIDTVNASIKKINGKDSINRLYLHQIAYIRTGIKVNICRRSFWPNEQLQFNVGAEMSLTNADSIYKKDIVMVNYYPEILYKVNRMENFGMEASIKYIVQVAAKSLNFFNDKPIFIFNPQVTLYYYPFSNPENRIYFKYAHFAEMFTKGKNSNYPQIQFGYKTNLFKKDK